MTTRNSSKKSPSASKPTAKLPRESLDAPAVAAVVSPSPQSVPEATGAAAFKRVKPLLLAIPPAEVVIPPLNLRVASLTALGVYGLIESHGLRPRMEAQAQLGEMDITQLDLLPELARATYYLRLQAEEAKAVTSEAMVPAALAAHAQGLRYRMLKLLGFHYDDNSKVAPRLDFIRRGTGYDDLAGDLVGLVNLYREFKTTIQQTTTHYRASDEKDAANAAAELMGWLGGKEAGGGNSSAELSSNELAIRAGQLMVVAYDEVTEVARYLCRRDPALAARFQSFYSLTRTRSAGASDAEPTPTDAAESDPETSDK